MKFSLQPDTGPLWNKRWTKGQHQTQKKKKKEREKEKKGKKKKLKEFEKDSVR